MKKKFQKPEVTIAHLTAELITTNTKLKEANEQLLKEKKLRNEMFANISHDLRSPITTIRNSIEYLLSLNNSKAPIPLEQLEPILTLMEKKIISLDSFINDIFLLSSLENETISFQIETIEIGIFLEDYFYSCTADSKFNARHLHLDVPIDFSVSVNIDILQMRRVLDNLFTNALKYSAPEASITLGAYQKDKNVIIYLQDTGIGIPKEELPKIFYRSYTVSKARTPSSNTSGTGLGLSIVKNIIQILNGSVYCESQEGEGSTFFISLPIALKK